MNKHRQVDSFESTAMHATLFPGSVRHVEFALPDEMQGIFIGEVRQRMFEMEVAIAHSKGHALGRAASSLQAVSSVVGAVETLAICCNIEFDAIAGRLGDARRRLGQLHELWDEALESSLMQA
ncbi:MAG TPA: hypothetical protein PK497_12325 [Burkholderiaceae bacterium]|nr:hypothetical protein [Burkholderiaceae bacterium]